MKRVIFSLLALAASVTGARAIVGGTEDQGPLAHASVMVLSSNSGVCSAVVLAPDVVLTAAHCVTGAAEHRVHFRDETGEPVLIVPSDKAVHPGYEPKAIEARKRSIDLALVHFREKLPARFSPAALGSAQPRAGAPVMVGGYGLAREGEAKTTGTFRTADLAVVEPYGPSSILLWSQGKGQMGACQGDSGGPMAVDGMVVAITSWSSATKGKGCGDITQGALVGPQRSWIDRTLAKWNRTARWND
ncbi:S1 family peptidase [Microvirga puerhi]|uniref:Trypsin-like serine protease n=1 Tax=Microvirga puerhi TaxID=2876078 RepID=A0ABS7VLL2_9HYPH|nr:trypsin-like serine protease [Microvirga puerhi]MBZ6076406.1 trypsin-like serine protease [Microvirga puerhi]